MRANKRNVERTPAADLISSHCASSGRMLSSQIAAGMQRGAGAGRGEARAAQRGGTALRYGEGPLGPIE